MVHSSSSSSSSGALCIHTHSYRRLETPSTMLKKFKAKSKSKEKERERAEDDKSKDRARRVAKESVDFTRPGSSGSASVSAAINGADNNDGKTGRHFSVASNASNPLNTDKLSRRSSVRLSSATQTAANATNNHTNNTITTPHNCNNATNTNHATSPTNCSTIPAYDQNAKREDTATKRFLNVIPQTFTPQEARRLEETILDPSDPQLPYGDGSDKLFGIENYGYICYVSSIFQCLYHTPQFRKSVLEYPPRDTTIARKRKYTVPGKDTSKTPHALLTPQNIMPQTQHLLSSRQSSSSSVSGLPAAPNSANSSLSVATSSGMRKYSLFSRSNTDSSSVADDAENGQENPNSIYNQSDFTITDLHKDRHLEKLINEKYPKLKDIEINYFLNSQKNITLVGIINDPSATLEWRKKAALIRGPIINLDEHYIDDYGMTEENMFTVLKDAFECITENASKTGVLSPYNLIEVIKRENILFRNAQHQDAHEFLNFLINNVLESMKSYNKESIITDIFEGELTSETKCLTCDNSSYRNEKFLDLSIDLEPDSSITNCLKIFSKIEMLNENNKFYCENCYSYQEAAKSIKLKKIPKVLTFHLKRFKYSEKLDRLVKLFYRVEYVKTLRISNTTKDSEQPDKLYELYGLVVHIGGGPYHGHYVSLVKTELYGWLLFDDETIEKIDEDYVFKFFGDGGGLATAYLLFYREVEDERKFIEEQLYSGLDDDESPNASKNLFAKQRSSNNVPTETSIIERDEEMESYRPEPIFISSESETATATPLTTPHFETTPVFAIPPHVQQVLEQEAITTSTPPQSPMKYTVHTHHAVDDFDPFSQSGANSEFGDASSGNYGGEHISHINTKSTVDTVGTNGTASTSHPAMVRCRSSMFHSTTNDSNGNAHSESNGNSHTGKRNSIFGGFRKKSST